MFKVNYQTEDYVQSSYISRGNRSALAKFRTGVAPPPPPLRIETGRYEALQLDQRVCFNCKILLKMNDMSSLTARYMNLYEVTSTLKH